jgi:hypothetical protein
MGCSRQRIHQIMTGYTSLHAILPRKIFRALKTKLIKCQSCDINTATILHRKDFNPQNNDISNISLVCEKCLGEHRHKNNLSKVSRCKICNKEFDVDIKTYNFKRGLCASCINIITTQSPKNRLFYPEFCKGCGQSTVGSGKRQNGYHAYCWTHSPEYMEYNRKRVRAYAKKRYASDPEFRAKHLAACKRYRVFGPKYLTK